MLVRSCEDQTESLTLYLLGQGASVGNDLRGVISKLRSKGLAKGHRFGGNDVHEGPALHPRKDRLVHFLRPIFFAQDEAGPWSAQSLMSSRSDEIRYGHRIGMQLGGYQPGNMGHVHHEKRLVVL